MPFDAPGFMKRHGAVAILSSALLVSVVAIPLARAQKGKTQSRQLRELITANEKMKKDLDETKKNYADLEQDRNNVLAQTKNLLQEKSKWSEAADELDQLKEANKVITDQKDKLLTDFTRKRADLEKMTDSFNRIKRSYQDLQASHAALDTENDQLRKSLARKVESSPQYQSVAKENRDFKSENARLKDTIKVLDAKLKKALDRVARIQDRDLKFAKQIQAYKKDVDDLKLANDNLTKTNLALNQALAVGPARFRDMAEENKRLKKETGEIHYNMGVFFTQNQRYDQAAKEFQRALDINPNDAKAHYNLGYLLAEQYNKNDEAMAHFTRYLQLSPDGQEADAVRNFLMSRDAYGNKAAAMKYTK